MITDYEKVFERIVRKTKDYIVSEGIQSLVLGISGGIDSTVVAAIGKEVSDELDIPLIGRSLTIKNGKEEFSLAKLVGTVFCDDFKEVYLWDVYNDISREFQSREGEGTNISEGNIMARLRMIYLYNLAGLRKGIVLDTDNLTEHYLGFWTIHGDEGDYNPIGGLWKTEVYGLAEYLKEVYKKKALSSMGDILDVRYYNMFKAVEESIAAIPTDGNVGGGDMDQIGARNYFDVDKVLVSLTQDNLPLQDVKWLVKPHGISEEVVEKIYDRWKRSEFKRRTERTIKITRDSLLIISK